MRVQTPTYQLDAHGIRVPGDATNDQPGAPALPVWSTVVELPADGDWRITTQTPGARLLDQGVDVAAVPVPDLAPPGPHGWAADVELPGAVPTVDRPDPAIYGANAFYPSSPVVPGAVQWMQGRRLLALRVFPFSYNPVTRQAALSSRRADHDRGDAGRASRSACQPEADAGPSNPAAMTTGALRIRTGGRGLYRLTYDDLLAAGVPLAHRRSGHLCPLLPGPAHRHPGHGRWRHPLRAGRAGDLLRRAVPGALPDQQRLLVHLRRRGRAAHGHAARCRPRAVSR